MSGGRDPGRYAVARRFLSQLAAPVVVVGAQVGHERAAATATAMYVSFAPPRLVVALHPGSRTCTLVERSRRFAVSVLDAGQVDVAEVASHGGTVPAELGLAPRAEDPRVEEILEREQQEGAQGSMEQPASAPVIATAPLAIWCRVVEELDVGDHRLFVGELIAVKGTEVEQPLLRHRRRYAALGPFLTEPDPAGYPT